MALSIARYSALLFVIPPTHSAPSRMTLRAGLQMTKPIAAGPGFPRAPPSENGCKIRLIRRRGPWTRDRGLHNENLGPRSTEHGARSSPVVGELKRKAVVLAADEGDGGLQFVLGFAGN